jgi:hypothetical protein
MRETMSHLTRATISFGPECEPEASYPEHPREKSPTQSATTH